MYNFANLEWYFYPIIAWTLVWKGLSMWRASERKEKVWFAVLLVASTLGILDILYLYVFSKMKKREVSTQTKTTVK